MLPPPAGCVPFVPGGGPDGWVPFIPGGDPSPLLPLSDALTK